MPNLQEATDWNEREKPSLAWALRYGSEIDYQRALNFLHKSVEDWEADCRREEEARARERRQEQALLEADTRQAKREAEQSRLEAQRQQIETQRLRQLGRKLIAMVLLALALAISAFVLYRQEVAGREEASKATLQANKATKEAQTQTQNRGAGAETGTTGNADRGDRV